MINEHAQQAYDFIQQQKPGFKAEIGIVLGSGLGPLADIIEDRTAISYNDLPGFKACSVEGHASQLLLGTILGVPVVCLQGRAHYYEGIDDEIFLTQMGTFKALGCKMLLATNASGSIREDMAPGSVAMITDHINYSQGNPLIGVNAGHGPAFIGMENAYDKDLQKTFHSLAEKIDIELREGVYIGVSGPSFETPAEIRMFRILGADIVGMSTIPEIVVARYLEMKVAAFAVISNFAAGMIDQTLSHDTTLQGVKLASDKLVRLVAEFIKGKHHV